MIPFPGLRCIWCGSTLRHLLLLALALAFVSVGPGVFGQAPTATQKIDEARMAYFKAAEPLEKAYREKFAELLLQEADKVEVYLLDFEMKDSYVNLVIGWDHSALESTYFPIMPYGSKSKILKRRVLSEEERKRLLPELRRLLVPEPGDFKGGAFCHYPIHGVRVWSDERVIFQTSFCWKCQNFYFEGPSGRAGWDGIGNAKLQPLMEELMPIPASEVARFEEKMRPKGASAPGKKKGK